MARRPRSLGLLLGAVLALSAPLGCGGSAEVAESPAAAAPVAAPRDADRIAASLVGGRVGGLVFVDRVRGHAIGPRLLTLGPVRELLDGTSFDPLQDLERVFVTGPSASEARAILFAEHTLPEDRVLRVVDELVNKSEPRGEVIAGLSFPAVKARRRGREGVIAFLPPRFVVAVPEDLLPQLSAFSATGGLPLPEGVEAARLVAEQPSQSLRARGAPPIPPTLSSGEALVTLRPDGGVSIDARARSESAAQADRDADALTRSLEDATTVSLGIVKIRAFKPVAFTSRDDDVVSHVDLSAGEVNQLLGLASTFIH